MAYFGAFMAGWRWDTYDGTAFTKLRLMRAMGLDIGNTLFLYRLLHITGVQVDIPYTLVADSSEVPNAATCTCSQVECMVGRYDKVTSIHTNL